MHRRGLHPLLGLLPLVALGWPGCRGGSLETPPTEATEAISPEDGMALEIQRLQALGYVDYADESESISRSGVIVHDQERAYPGYNLYTIRALGRAELVDNTGRLVHAWSDSEPHPWKRAVLLQDGDLLVVGGVVPDAYLLRLAWDNRVRWRLPLNAHHDVNFAPDGRLVTLTMKKGSVSSIDASTPVRDDLVTIFDPGSPGFEDVSLHDAIVSSAGVLSLKPVDETMGLIDLIHANSVRFMDRPLLVDRHTIYDPGNLLICMRHQDAIGVLDWDEKRFVWAWGQDELEWPHDATVLDNGNILVFDNGVQRKWSRVIELDPLTREIVWEYRAPEPGDFYTKGRGSAQRLPNGNTLIAESNSGRAFEVTPDGEIVWDYRHPHLDEAGHRATIIRLYRYETELVEVLLGRGVSGAEGTGLSP